ncbi:hypothetical protein CDAR_194361 [Caerostris darwini]|uniref:Uncharacterized protein n=1 Tax=Caerostris darwini TaxID=1538125 RepID=A0AAV4NL07_9ARAC|nr:hypothetical protein CDAR_194361 [Caerostris darwini]
MSGRGSDRSATDCVEMNMQTDDHASGEDDYEFPISPSQNESSLLETTVVNQSGKHPSDTYSHVRNDGTDGYCSPEDELAQRQIYCDGIRRTTLMIKKANDDIQMTEHYRKQLGSNNDVILDELLSKKAQDLINQRNGLEEQVREYGVCPID